MNNRKNVVQGSLIFLFDCPSGKKPDTTTYNPLASSDIEMEWHSGLRLLRLKSDLECSACGCVHTVEVVLT
jgi:hypothetical protein